jgi:hypothetical protein
MLLVTKKPSSKYQQPHTSGKLTLQEMTSCIPGKTTGGLVYITSEYKLAGAVNIHSTQSIPISLLHALYDSMPKRVRAVKKRTRQSNKVLNFVAKTE